MQLFVYLKVLKVPSTSELIFQTALTSSELTQIFTNAPVDASLLVPLFTSLPFPSLLHLILLPSFDVNIFGQADKKVRTEYTQLVNPSAPKDAPNTPKQRPIEGDCPVCFDASMNSFLLFFSSSLLIFYFLSILFFYILSFYSLYIFLIFYFIFYFVFYFVFTFLCSELQRTNRVLQRMWKQCA